eukprot:NODE_2470_length_1168_cov_2.789625_g2354_i0.p1 GENE.NODE_2470_length_1168_cov_2.789625_g2354_i0~~NODE_2470_length_1168_cov_2.789625_g2354_i0.p1  ORF type:complete len:365 (-),score=101.77 NODE_2470_length_1168_cov_2.789625_g2354_i0:47-1141(-)
MNDYRFDGAGLVECKGWYGQFGGCDANPQQQKILDELTEKYLVLKEDPSFQQELRQLQHQWAGRPTPIYHAKGLSKSLQGGQIYLKREDLIHTGAHKVNHCLEEALLAKQLGKRRIITETAGVHGLCLAAAAACTGLECEIYIGGDDWDALEATRMQMELMGAKLVRVDTGKRNLKEATDRAFQVFIEDPEHTFYGFSSIAGPQPFPTIVKDSQAIVGEEAREQILSVAQKLPEHVCGCVAGGSNALGIFQCFLTDDDVKLYAVEPELASSDNAVVLGKPGAGYLDSFALLHEIHSVSVPESMVAAAFLQLARCDGIIPNWESCYALAHGIQLAKTTQPEEIILVNLSGRGTPADVQKARRFVQ